MGYQGLWLQHLWLSVWRMVIRRIRNALWSEGVIFEASESVEHRREVQDSEETVSDGEQNLSSW